MISCLDAWLNLVYPVHDGVEENPFARQILIASNNDIALLIAIKAVGTILALAFLRDYYYYNRGRAYIIAGALALIQVACLCYIVMG